MYGTGYIIGNGNSYNYFNGPGYTNGQGYINGNGYTNGQGRIDGYAYFNGQGRIDGYGYINGQGYISGTNIDPLRTKIIDSIRAIIISILSIFYFYIFRKI
jgi:hypothetical protein